MGLTRERYLQKKAWKEKLNNYAKQIESKNYKSDIWLKERMERVLDKNDEFNSPEGPYIPDLINRKKKYIVECDGSIHDLEEVKLKDFKKDRYFLSKGFKVFRVDYGDEKKIFDVIESISMIKYSRRSKVIIRRKASP